MTAIAVSRIDQERFNVEWRSSRRRTAKVRFIRKSLPLASNDGAVFFNFFRAVC